MYNIQSDFLRVSLSPAFCHRPCHRSNSRSLRLKVSALSSSSSKNGAVLILPGFLFGSEPYEDLAQSLQARGYAADVVPLAARDWWPILFLGQDFTFYLQRMDAALTSLYNKHGPVTLIGHSAGGWVARILLGDKAPYQGRVYGRTKMVKSLITLGTPHGSIEAYPFGRVPEKLEIVADKGETVPEGVYSSSLQFCNYFYPTAQSFPEVQIVCAVGNAITGEDPIWRSSGNRAEHASENGAKRAKSGAGILTLPGRALATATAVADGSSEAWFAYESYKSGCGRGDVPGDGVTPVCIAHLPGAENVVLEGIWHGPKSRPGRPWYGDRLESWIRYLEPGYAAP